MGDRPFPWIEQTLPGVDPPDPRGPRPGEVECPNCHYAWRRRRVRCPACHTRLDQPATSDA